MLVYGRELSSRLFVGSARYPSPDVLRRAVEVSEASVVTVSIRRQKLETSSVLSEDENPFWNWIQSLDAHLLPNTAGCRTARQAVDTAHLARELFQTDWIKLEVIADDYTLQPDPFELVIAAEELCREGFKVFPYMTDDLKVAEKLMHSGCEVLMPWGSPIGSGRGIINPSGISTLRARFPESLLVLDAGIGRASHAAHAMELGCDAVLVNTAIAQAMDPVQMARGFKNAVTAGRDAFLAGPMTAQDFATPSTPITGIPFSSGGPFHA